ncbi:hypothetical protein Y032_0435g1422 [Ancylostoma ceylanicum]|uniref:Endonuclease/exonuclease/phosphatase domain-containing protein n=1 Tax=Ancylostoma ceylanicum TaxID=53326 RepID=A0A016X064_9BILA|nr:hypothetical protein Y032_0435g1422 [Ancylostoma ceylanicum]
MNLAVVSRHHSFGINLRTYNIRTPNSDAALSFLLDELHNIKIDIVAVCETRRKKDMSMKWNSESEAMLGAAKNGVGGIGFIVLPPVSVGTTCIVSNCDFEA